MATAKRAPRLRRASGEYLIGAACSFWMAWFLMPGLGVTDTREIFRLVGSHRANVSLSTFLQLCSAVVYVLAMVRLAADPQLGAKRAIRGSAVVVLLGALGSAADSVLHRLAYA